MPTPNTRAFGPRIGPDYLLFLSGRGGSDGLWKLENGFARELWKASALEGDFGAQNFFLIDLNTGEQRRLTALQSGFQVQNFDVSPDGKRIAFDRLRDNADVVLMYLMK